MFNVLYCEIKVRRVVPEPEKPDDASLNSNILYVCISKKMNR